ncbi:hypothetical protein, partial [Nocardia asteroides]|uniref:hypothetical protein n=1 Tax=Nocardia asteroides TaxID=1824 RepID=UPI00365AF1D9
EGDRRNAESHDLAWPAAELVAEYLAAGDLPRANGLLRHAASSVPPAETAMAISSCRVVGVPDAAEAIVVQAKLRGPIGVMEIAYHLIETSSYADASALLRSGVEFSGGGAA